MKSRSLRIYCPVCRPHKRSATVAPGLLLLGLAFSAAFAQESPKTGRGWLVVPSISAATTYYEVSGVAADPTRLGAEVITQLAPSLLVSSQSGSVRGSVDYSLVGTAHSRRRDRNAINNALNGSGIVEIVPDWAYVDLRANVSQQAASPFGLQPTPGSLTTDQNLREVATWTVSPYVRGELASLMSYELRFSGNSTNVRRSTDGDSTNFVTSLRLQSRIGPKLGWGVLATQQRVAFQAGRSSDVYRFSVDGNYRPDADLLLTLRVGAESTNVGTPLRDSYANWGFGLRWTPSARTLISVDGDRRYFGNGHQIVVEHRLRRAAVRFTSIRGATAGSDATGVGSPVTLFQLYMLQYASIEPDSVSRELRVRELLRLTNQNPNTLIVGGLATSAISLQTRDDLALSYVGQRSSVTVLGFTSSTQAIDRVGSAALTARVRQVGASVAASHRLTPLTSMTLTANYQRTLDSLVLQPPSSLSSVALGLTTALSPSTTVSLTARHSVFEGQPFPNRENALSASANVRF